MYKALQIYIYIYIYIYWTILIEILFLEEIHLYVGQSPLGSSFGYGMLTGTPTNDKLESIQKDISRLEGTQLREIR